MWIVEIKLVKVSECYTSAKIDREEDVKTDGQVHIRRTVLLFERMPCPKWIDSFE